MDCSERIIGNLKLLEEIINLMNQANKAIMDVYQTSNNNVKLKKDRLKIEVLREGKVDRDHLLFKVLYRYT